jgi:hypothetical protein
MIELLVNKCLWGNLTGHLCTVTKTNHLSADGDWQIESDDSSVTS